MDRSYFEYSQIVESFINRQGTAGASRAGEIDGHFNQTQSGDDRDRRMKLAFLNVLREEMLE
ncbi:MAG: hypothetical protein ACE37D_16050 [Pseudomonadales bacterium]|jgi:hypothetical protein